MAGAFRKTLMAAAVVAGGIVGAMQTGQAAPVLSVNPADFDSLTVEVPFNSIPPSDPLVGSELTTQAAPTITFAGGFFLYLDAGSNTVFGTNFSNPLSPNNPVGMQFGTDITQIAFDFAGIDGSLSFAVSRDGGAATVLPVGISSGLIGIVDPEGFDTIIINVTGGAAAFAMSAFAFGGTPAAVPEPSSMLAAFAGVLLASRLRGRGAR